MANKKITTYFLENVRPSENSEREIYWDTELPKFGVRIGKTSKTFICEYRVNGKNERVTLGRFPNITVADARRKAIEAFSKMSTGIRINEERKQKQRESVTLREAYDSYINDRELRPATLVQYNNAMTKGYADFLDLPVQSISKDMVEDRHVKIMREISGQTANKYTRTLRAVLNYAIAKYEDDSGNSVISTNPVIRVSQTRKWARPRRKTGHLKLHQIALVLDELNKVPNQIVADYIRFVLFTGCRRREVSTMPWSDIDLKNRSFFVIDELAKNHNRLELPLSDYLMEIAERRHAGRVNDYVFPAGRSESGHIEEPKKTVIAIGKAIGHHFTLHDLRRTFITIAESIDISAYALKALVNHKLSSSDVTAGYIQMNCERLRAPMQRITDHILGRQMC